MHHHLLLAAAGIATSVVVAAHAAPTVHLSTASFLAATSAAATDSFDDLGAGDSGAGPLARQLGAYSYTARAANGLWGLSNPDDPADRWLSVMEATDGLHVDDFSSNVHAVGGSFFNTGFDGNKVTLAFSVVGIDGHAATFEHVFDGAGGFFGIVSDAGIASLRIGGSYSAADGWTFPTMNDLVVGGPAAPVPEPGRLALALGGLVLVSTLARARRAASPPHSRRPRLPLAAG